MMLPDRTDDRVVAIHRTLDAAEEDLTDAITAFAEREDLELDRRNDGEGLLFRRKSEGGDGPHLFKRGDILQVIVTESGGSFEVDFVADLRDSIRRKSSERRGQAFRSLGLAGFFAFLGVRGLMEVVSIGDFVMFGLSAMFGSRAVRKASSDADDVDELQRKVANALSAVCDDAQYGAEPD